MKNILILLLFVVSFVSIFFNFKSNAIKLPRISQSNTLSAHVAKVIDGDTIDVDNGERIRLYEIDAPEYPKGCLSEDAKVRLENLIDNKLISYEKIGKDNFGRILAYAYVNSLFINEVMLEEGLAYYYKSYNQTERSLYLEKLQEKAKLAFRGIWSPLCQSKKEGCLIKGNYRSANNTRLYHTPDCYNYDRITIKPGTTDRWFCSENEAKQAGFVKSKDCP